MSLRLALLGVVALIVTFAVGAPAALAADDPQLAEAPPADTAPASAPTPVDASASAGDIAAGAEIETPAASSPAGQELGNAAVSQASNEAEVNQTAGQGQEAESSTGDDALGQSQTLEQNAGIGQEAGSAATADQEPTTAGDAGNSEQEVEKARSDASNEARIEQESRQEQGGRSATSGTGQVQHAEQNAEISQDATSEAVGGQAPETTALTQLPWAGGIEEIAALVENGSLMFQAIWQVQHGCNNHCTGTSQSQSATQNARTTQDATVVADGGMPAGAEASGGAPPAETAEARNRSITVQFVWQTQIGCVAFCFETSQTQFATQWAQTNQSATTEAGSAALAENLSRTIQLVWQLQEGCREECYGTSQIQVVTQGQLTTESAAGTSWTDAPVLAADGTVVLPGWLLALARNLGVTIQTVYQLQGAVCAEYCQGDSQVQVAVQQAEVSQAAEARAGEPPPPPPEPPAAERPAQHAPTAEPPATPSGAPAQPTATPAAATALAAVGDPSSPVSRRLRSQLIELAPRGSESRLRSLVLVLPADILPRGQKPSSAMSAERLAAPLTAMALHSTPTEPRKSHPAKGAQHADSLSAATTVTAPAGTAGGGAVAWLWIWLLAASLALLPALRRVAP